MTVIEKLKEWVNFPRHTSIMAYEQLADVLKESAKKCEAENRLASVSSYDFVCAFQITAKAICEGRTTPNTETYISLCDEAAEMLLRGMNQADVLHHFDLIFERENNMIKDSGERREFDTGAVRDIQEGKGRCDLLPLDVVSDYMSIAENSKKVLVAIKRFMETGDTVYLKCALDHFGKVRGWDENTMILEVSIHFEEGAKKYGEHNCQKGIPTHCYIDSAVRHYMKWLRGDKDEPHDRAFVWNILCCIWTCLNKPELNEFAKGGDQ